MTSSFDGSIAIIGGGLSGLATAAQIRVRQSAAKIRLFESASRLGGVIHTEWADGFLIDHGADMFATNPPGALDLIQKLGAEDQLIEPEPTRRGARIARGGKLVPIPDGFVLMRATKLGPMLRTGLLSPAGKLRFLAERYVGSPESLHEPDFDESVDSFVRRRMGDEVLESIVAPLSAGIYTADVSKLSMAATMGPIAQMEREYGSLARATAARRRSGQDNVERGSTGARYGQFRAFGRGMIQLIETLASTLHPTDIHTDAPVQSIVPTDGRWKLTTAGGRAETFDRVVVALPPRASGKLVADVAPVAAQELAGIESASTAIVVLGVRTADIAKNIDTFGFVVPLSENRRILAGSFASHKFAGRAPEGHVLVRVFIGGAMQSELLENDDAGLVRIAREELADLIGLSGDVAMSRVVRWNEAMPQYHVGHKARVGRIKESIDQTPGLSLISNSLDGVGIAPVIAAAGRLADRLVSV